MSGSDGDIEMSSAYAMALDLSTEEKMTGTKALLMCLGYPEDKLANVTSVDELRGIVKGFMAKNGYEEIEKLDATSCAHYMEMVICFHYIAICERYRPAMEDLRRTVEQYRKRQFKTYTKNCTSLYREFCYYFFGGVAMTRNTRKDLDARGLLEAFEQALLGNHAPIRKFFVTMDQDLQITDNSLAAIRRLTMDWRDLTLHERRLTVTKLLQYMRYSMADDERLAWMERIATVRGYEITDFSTIPDPDEPGVPYPLIQRTPSIWSTIGVGLKHLAWGVAGAYAGYQIVKGFKK